MIGIISRLVQIRLTSGHQFLRAVLLIACFAEPAVANDSPIPNRLNSLPSEDPDAPSPYWLDEVRNCGPKCLHFLEQWFGGRRSFREVSSACPPASDGVSLADLVAAGRGFGWGVTPFQGPVGQLARLRHPAILHLTANPGFDRESNWKDDHYLVLLGYNPESGQYLVYDPPADVRSVDHSFLSARFSGWGILIDPSVFPELDTAVESASYWPVAMFVVGVGAGCGMRWIRGRTWAVPARSASIPLLFTAWFTSVGCGEPAGNSAPLTRHFDAGRAIEGVKIDHVFTLENRSAAPFAVKKVSGSCACTRTLLEDATIPVRPGERRRLEVRYDTQAERGAQRKTFVVETDSADAEWQRIEFTLAAEVFRPVQSIPDVVQFGAVPRGKPTTKYVTLEVNDDAWTAIEPRVSHGNVLRVNARPGGTPRMRRYELVLTPPRTNGPLHDRVSFLYTRDGQDLEVVVPIQADVAGLLRVIPRRILVTDLDKSLGVRQRLLIASPGKRLFRLLDLELPEGVTAVGELPLKAAAEQDVEFEIDAAKLPAGQSLIGVITDVVEDARLEIPLVLTEHAAKKS